MKALPGAWSPLPLPAGATPPVDAFAATLVHPFKDEVQRIREPVLAVDPSIAEGVKRNAPGFRATKCAATTNLRVRGYSGGMEFLRHLPEAAARACGGFRADPPAGVRRDSPGGGR